MIVAYNVWAPSLEIICLRKLQIEPSGAEDDDGNDFEPGPVDFGGVACDSILIVGALNVENGVVELVCEWHQVPRLSFVLG